MHLSLPAPVAPIAAHELLIFLLQIGLLLLLALTLGQLARRFGMPAVVGELFVGVVLGPSFLAHVAPDVSAWLFPQDGAQFHLLDAVGQIGVILLVGITGIHMDMGLVRRRGATAAGVSLGGLIVPLAFGIGAGFLLPASLVPDGTETLVFALFLGVAMCVSAIPVIAKTLMDMGLLHRNVGQLTLTAGMIDDAFGWLMLSVVSAMATTGLRAGNVALSVAYLAAVLVFAFVVGRPLVRHAFRLVSRGTDPGPSVATAAVLILLASAGTHAVGLEAVFGAFICGVLIGNTKGVDPARLAPLRSVVLYVFAPIFFATAGLRMDMTSLADPMVLLAGLAVLAVAIIGKFVGAYAGARASRLNRWEALALGAGLNARGVIEVVVAMVGLRLGILSVEVYTIVILVAIVTSLMAPPILRWAMARVEQTAEEELRESEQLSWATGQPQTDTSEHI
ncbi:Kef-type K+ transport system membrane component KefB [Streptosporangium becharense]|uniref:Kef-type K+ transport system membrane component KefB n=1 Tax=Streptosporangium becharense TaxID=1816182 RepID=A0A7W9IN35_9ACTN|nr:cation:proton antiporter [Streptosporangium becharense]MBB2914526.1 Kef-type K+ transport system membrane component KefB [Streptosporangium becharense]MBB5823371.1 Kef-type K+ transport system membrane component KefB [Streptosporangium becharense]